LEGERRGSRGGAHIKMEERRHEAEASQARGGKCKIKF